jgi:signal transduction histidine kinase
MEAMQDGIITDEELKQLAPDLTKSVQHTMRLIENVFMWAKRQMEGEEVHWSLVDVSKIVYQKIEAVQIEANKKGISINNTIVGVQTFKTDGEMIDLILRNLLANSIKFCRPGDSITVAIETKETEWWLIVKDTGIGMTKEQLEKVSTKIHFTTFGTSNEKGSGLGLIIIRDFTNQLGGRFWVESEKDRGSCFYIALPHFVD